MKKILNTMMAAVTLLLPLTSCTEEEPAGPGSGGTGGAGSIVVGVGDDMPAFDVTFDDAPLKESEVVPTDPTSPLYNEYFENKTFSNKLMITYSDGKAEIAGEVPGVAVEVKGAGVVVNSTVANVEYELKGVSANGFFRLYGDFDSKVTLAGVKLTNPTGAVINSQSKGITYLHIAENSVNELTDGATYTPIAPLEDMKGCIFAEGKLVFSGKGVLDIKGNCKNGIASDAYVRFRPGNVININNSASNGVKAKLGVYINGGVLNIDVKGVAAKGINSEGLLQVDGGRTIINASGESEFNGIDLSNAAGIKCDFGFTMNNGILAVKSVGKGGKGINVNQGVNINGGELTVLVTGSKFVYSPTMASSPKGINCDLGLSITGGKVKVRVNNKISGEGLESKTGVAISGGLVEVSTIDDCIKAMKSIEISGGSVYAYSVDSDALDTMGSVTISGGQSVLCGSNAKDGVDCNTNPFVINGGTLVAVGSGNSAVTSSKQGFAVYETPAKGGVCFGVVDAAGKGVVSYKLPRDYSPMQLLVSAPSMSASGKYTVKEVSSLTGGNFHGLF